MLRQSRAQLRLLRWHSASGAGAAAQWHDPHPQGCVSAMSIAVFPRVKREAFARRSCPDRNPIERGEDTIKLVLTWMDGWYKGDSDEAIIDIDVFVANAKNSAPTVRRIQPSASSTPPKKFSE